MMFERIKGLKIREVACDEIWGYVGMKARTKKDKAITDSKTGDAWCFIGMERYTKLILAWHLGHRNADDTFEFTEKIAHATEGSFQINTDGFPAYRDAIITSLGAQSVDFAQVIKIYRSNPENETRYSPSTCVGCEKVEAYGWPDLDRATTSHIERQNLTVRMSMRRMTRLTNAFSKKWLNLKRAYALQFAYYNFCRVHGSLQKCTPAMVSGLTNHVWTLEELIAG
jgi:IS1 family transposase